LRVFTDHPQPFHQLIAYNARGHDHQYIVKHYQTLHLRKTK